MPGPLHGLRVLDLSRLLPGPYASLLLADLGADVVKVEDPNGGDYLRQMPPFVGDESALFLGLNRNKRSIALDLKSADGKAALTTLAGSYDVLLESFRPGVMERLGLSYPQLAALHPRLIYCAVTGYGQTGPDRLRAGHDLNYLARSGLLGYAGGTDGPPPMAGAQVADIGGGALFAVVGILAAVLERQRTGQGKLVDVSMTDGALAFVHMALAARLLQGQSGAPLSRGTEALNGGYACYQVYRCRDGKYLAVGALEPKFFQGVCEVLGRPELVEQGYDVAGGGAKRAKEELSRCFAEKTRDEWAALFFGKDLCVEPVWEGDELLRDEQLRARGLFVEEGGRTWLKTPLSVGDVPPSRPPALGEHTEPLLREAGCDEALLERLRPVRG